MIQVRFHIKRGGFVLQADLDVPATGITALFGPSGSGKTTLLRAIAGLERHADGFLKVGEEVWHDDRTFVPPHRRRVGYVFQEASLFPHLTVKGNLDYGLRRVPETERRVSLKRAVDLLGISSLLSRRTDQLSGGERQRVAIARALAVSPRLLLMDEPLASLDAALKRDILPYIDSLRHELKIPVIYVSHQQDEVARLGDHMVLLESGRVAASGSVLDLLTRLDLSMAHEPEATSIIEAKVSGHDEAFHLTYLDFPGGRFTVPREDLAVGDKARLQIAARDVSMTLTPSSDSSILNIFPAVVERISHEGRSQATVRLKVGDVAILARVTRKSAVRLRLETGSDVFAQVKSVALLSA